MLIVAPLTTGSRPARFRVPIVFREKAGLVLLDQMRALDRARLIRHLGHADKRVLSASLRTIQGMFAE
jgi:mRNA interferase MazF